MIQFPLVVAQLLFLEAGNPKKEISMYINSPEGIVTSGLSIYDTMQYRAKISTLCIGQAASMGSLLLAQVIEAIFTNSRISLHQPSGGFQKLKHLILRCMQKKSWVRKD